MLLLLLLLLHQVFMVVEGGVGVEQQLQLFQEWTKERKSRREWWEVWREGLAVSCRLRRRQR